MTVAASASPLSMATFWPAALAEGNPLADQPPYVVALLVLGILLVTASMFIGLRNRKQRGADHITARERLERAKQREGLKRDLEGLAVEIEDMARRLGAQLDNKAARLEQLLDQADAAAARLEQARLAMLHPASAGDTPASRNGPASSAAAPAGAPAAHRLASDVDRLRQQGLSPADIARATGQDIGKIELILALRNV